MEHDSTAQYGGSRTTELQPWLTVTDVAAVYKKGRSFVYELVRSGELHPVRVGQHFRFDPDDVRAYLDRLREPVKR